MPETKSGHIQFTYMRDRVRMFGSLITKTSVNGGMMLYRAVLTCNI